MANHTFCIQGAESLLLEDSDAMPVTKCCLDNSEANCPEVSDASWNCSSVYADKTYAKQMCPKRRGCR